MRDGIGVLVSGRLHPAPEEANVREQVELVRADGCSRAVLLYGAGGVGKTQLVRTLADESAGSQESWVPPIDVDDPEYWLLSNIERVIAEFLDPKCHHFAAYFDHLARLRHYVRGDAGPGLVVSHLARINGAFVTCYHSFVTATGHTVVITMDTVEAIRDTHLLISITQWMKVLPGTLFIMAGRPPARDRPDALHDNLSDPHYPLPVTMIEVSWFNRARCCSAGRSSRTPT